MKHGTTRSYNLEGCRCGDCKAANSVYRKDYRKRNPSKASEDAAACGRRRRALTILGQRYPDELREIIKELERS